MKEYIKMTDNALKKYLTVQDNPQKKIYEAMAYSLFAGGKRLRPVIMLMTAKMCGKNPEICLPFACALEMIHTYSLIHDDLPSMDNDDLRRGKPTNHKVFGEAMAILAGDALLNKAFEVVSEYESDQVPDRLVLKAISCLATASGTEGMIGGQVVDIESCNEDMELLKYLHSLKTGALIRAAGVVGAILSGATDEQIAAIDSFCLNLGIAFQIQDDILDAYGDEAELGKPIGSDAQNGRSTYITLCGYDKSVELAEEYTNKALDSLSIFPENTELTNLCKLLLSRRS
ncbi:MAG: polyprenyl synthetase family protein [Ruminococcaceae bacterium]|nr:polyprenyl synthetase family protein [Oscillospiraceae bacterium]